MLERSQKETTDGASEAQELVSLESLAEMTGFPVEMIRKELFNSELKEEKVSLEDLRAAMVNYIDSTMLENAGN